MGAAVLSSIAAPIVGQIVGGIAQNILGKSGAAGGPFGNILGAFTSAFSPLLGQAASGPLGGLVAQIPSLFSTAGMSPQSFSDPLSKLMPDMDRFRYVADSDAVIRDHRGDVNVRDHRIGTRSSVSSSETDVLNQLQAESDSAKEALLKDPKNSAKALAAQEAMQALQTVAQLLFQNNSIKASIASNAIQSSKVS